MQLLLLLLLMHLLLLLRGKQAVQRCYAGCRTLCYGSKKNS